ncbi:MAG: glycosyltransferase family 2 protein [Haloplanus sp.]
MKASIVIRTYNEATHLPKTLRCIDDQQFSDDHEVVVVDSGSTDGTVDIARTLDVDVPVNIVEITQAEFSYGRALNLGADASDGEYVVNLSAHCPPLYDDWLRSLVGPLESRDAVAGVYGKQVSEPKRNPYEAVEWADTFPDRRAVFESYDEAISGTKADVFAFSNSNCAVRKRVWEANGFDEQLAYAEDNHWARRILRRGHEIVYEPDAAVYHSHPVTFQRTYNDAKNSTRAFEEIESVKRSHAELAGCVAYHLLTIPVYAVHAVRMLYEQGELRQLPSVVPFVTGRKLGRIGGYLAYHYGPR